MYFEQRLWGFTKAFRGRIFWAVCVGLASAAVGVARLALLGWLLAKVFAGEPAEALIGPFILVAAIMALRGFLEYGRNMIAHVTAAIVQMKLRKKMYAKVVELGPANGRVDWRNRLTVGPDVDLARSNRNRFHVRPFSTQT